MKKRLHTYPNTRSDVSVSRFPSALRIFLVVIFSFVIGSCNTATFEQDAKHAYRKARNVAEDGYDQAKEKVENTFDPETQDLIDPNAGLSKKDYRDRLKGKPPVTEDRAMEPVLPDVSQLLVEPRPPVIGNDKLVTLSVTEDVPLKEVLVELARRADVDIEVDPGITGGIIFRATDKPFSEIIERIASLTGLRYSVKNGVLKIERDTPYIVNYKVDLLNLNRSNTGSVNISTNVLSAVNNASSGGGNSNAFNTGSTSSITSSYQGDVWTEVQNGVQRIIQSYSGRPTTYNANTRTPAAVATTDVVAGTGIAAAPTPPPAGGGAAAAPLGPGQDGSAVLSVNRQAGLVTVLATDRQHKEIKRYIDKVVEQQNAQVLIEAKIVEVNLQDRYRSGIQWDLIGSRLFDYRAQANFTNTTGTLGNQVLQFAVLPTEILGFDGATIESVITLLGEFGVTRTLSSPRINATNNQQAILTFAENRVYFELDVQEQQTGTGTTAENTLTVDSNVRTVPIGIILSLMPSIDLEKGEIAMNIRPTLSRFLREVADPGVALLAARTNSNVASNVPVVEVREMDSMLRIKSGQVMVIGGFVEEKSVNNDVGVPGLMDIPYVGNLFKSVDKQSSMVETVIFIKATIMPSHGVPREDKEFYRTFGNDSRPLSF